MTFSVIESYFPQLLVGLLTTIEVSIGALLLATGIGLVVGLMRAFGKRWLYVLTVPYVEGFRSVPPLVVLFFAYFALPLVLGVDISSFTAAVLALGVAGGAYMSEIIRSGVGAIGKTQWEAAYSLGMRYPGVVTHIVLPQALRVSLPPAVSLYVALIKDTSLVSVVGVVDLTQAGMNIRGVLYGQGTIVVFLAMAVMYFVICYTASQGGLWVERRSRF